MRYENYHRKIKLLSSLLSKVVKHLVLILAVTGALLVTAVTLTAIKGTPGQVSCDSVVYGDSLEYEASAVFSPVSYEFCGEDGQWTDAVPYQAGTYRVRAVGTTAFGGNRRGKATTFTIDPRPLLLQTADQSVVYGDDPTVTAEDLQYGDALICEGFSYGNVTAASTQVTPDVSSVRILDADGNDVTQCYTIEANSSQISFKKRSLTVTTGDSSKVYDGTALTFDQYEITGGTLGRGDTLTATLRAAITDAGTTSNTPEIVIYHWQDGQAVDVTSQYELTVVLGTLSVEKRTLLITTGSTSATYTGQAISCADYSMEGQLAPGHTLCVPEKTQATDAGVYANAFSFQILDATGNDVSGNYSLICTWGTLSIDPAPLTFTTASETWVYDGTTHSCTDHTVEGLLSGHTAQVSPISPTEEDISIDEDIAEPVPEVDVDFGIIDDIGIGSFITYAGSCYNHLALTVYDGETDVTANYTITYEFGTLTVTPRPITVTTASESRVYDGTQLGNNIPICDNLADGDWIEVSDQPTISMVGQYSNAYTVNIFNRNGLKVTSSYDITYVYGTLEITPRPITITTGSGSWVYDGNVHENLSVSTDNLVGGNILDPVVPLPSIVNVGSCENKAEYIIYSGKTDVTACYDITYVYGTLEITPRPVSVYTASHMWVYDGEAHDDSSIYYIGMFDDYIYDIDISGDSDYEFIYGLVHGHSLVATSTVPTITDVGSCENRFDIAILSAKGEDVTSNYDLTFDYGTLEVTPRPIIIGIEDTEKYYDGTPLYGGAPYITDDSPYDLAEGHQLSAQVDGSRTKVGVSASVLRDPHIYDQNGRDVTANYEIETREGSITILQTQIIVVSYSDSKYYDGTPLTCPEYTYAINGVLVEGHDLTIQVTGTITDPGSVDNTITVKITDRNGRNVSDIYELVLQEGTLTVYEQASIGIEDDTVFGLIKSDRDGILYLRMTAYGDFSGRVWSAALPYTKLLPNGLNYSYLTSLAILNSGGYIHTLQFRDMRLAMLPYYSGLDGDYTIPSEDVSAGDNYGDWAMTYYEMTGDYASLQGNLGDYAQYEQAYREFVYQYYLTVDEETLAYMQGIIEAQGFSLDDPDIISKIARYIQNAASYSLTYDPALDMAENVAIAFLDTYKEGKCTHYATAATLLYRALGIPARYVEGFMIKTQQGEYVQITNPGHAWVEVYIDGVGWVQVEVTGGSSGSSSKSTITISPAYAYKRYDGEYLYPSTYEYNDVLQELLDQGYWFGVTVTGEQLEVGTSYATIIEFTLYDPDGVDVTDQYNVVCGEGLLEVLPADQQIINIVLYQLQKYYDGTALTFETGDYALPALPEGVTLQLWLDISLTEPGSLSLHQLNGNISRYATFRVYDADGKDVSDQYCLRFISPYGEDPDYVPIQVSRRALTLASASQTKYDDGTALENDEVYIIAGSLIAGHTLEAAAQGYLDGEGSTSNTLDRSMIRIVDSEGNDVTAYYNISIQEGTLTILPAE